LYPLKVLDWTHPRDDRYFLGVGFDATLGNDEPEQYTPWDPKNAFPGVELDVV
jgi:hypothetical protein